MLYLKKISAAHALADSWDKLSDSYFQQKKFLEYSEKHNPCSQRYYLAYHREEPVAGAIVYDLKLDIFTFSTIKYPVKFKIIGIPASVSDAGLVGKSEFFPELVKHIFNVEKGLLLFLNTPPGLNIKPAIYCRTLPTIVLKHNFSCWEDYCAALRSPYRRRLKRITALTEDVKIIRSKCKDLTREAYGLYLQIMERTKTKLEILSYDFFREMPDEFTLNTYMVQKRAIAWNICLRGNDRYVFFFGGLDYAMNEAYAAYFNSLTDITMQGIDLGYGTIEYGQTAETPKMKLGGLLHEKQMLLYHSNVMIRKALSLAKIILSYSRKPRSHHVFKLSAKLL